MSKTHLHGPEARSGYSFEADNRMFEPRRARITTCLVSGQLSIRLLSPGRWRSRLKVRQAGQSAVSAGEAVVKLSDYEIPSDRSSAEGIK